jgi:hypothetical protein
MTTGSRPLTATMYFYRNYLRCWAILLGVVAASVYVLWTSWWGGAVFGALLAFASHIYQDIRDVTRWISAFETVQAHCTPGDKL